MTDSDRALSRLLTPEATLHRLVDQLAVRVATERLTAPAPGILYADEEDLADATVDGAPGLGQLTLLADLHLAGASR